MSSHKNTFRDDTNAVSEVIGEVLMTAIAVLAFTVIAVFVFSYADSREMVYADIQGWVDTDSDTVYLRHAGGQVIDISNTRIMLNVNGTIRELSSAELLNQKGGSIWKPGEVLSINTSSLWGSGIAPADHISTTIIDVDTNLVIMSGWLTGNTRYMEEGSGMSGWSYDN